MTAKQREYSNIIGGMPSEASQTLPIRNPANDHLVGRMPIGTIDDLNAAVAAAREAAPGWANSGNDKRKTLCLQIAKAIGEHADELAALLTQEQGKPLNGFGSRWEIGGAQAWCQYTANLEIPVEVLQDDAHAKVELHRQPIGVVGSITPWNFPVMIAIWHLIPAIRAGNTVVSKPSPNTPLATLRLVELMNDVLPAGVVNIVCGGDEIGAAMSEHPGIEKMVFTGSTSTGKKIMASASESLKRLTLELGGNDAAIVLPDVDVSAVAEGIFWGAMLNNGQTCACIKRLYVHDDVYEALCVELSNIAKGVVIGDGMDEQSLLGPMQDQMQYDIVATLVERAKRDGAKILCGGDPAADDLFYPITLVADIQNDAELVQEEQFGPALPIVRYSSVEQALAWANDNPNGLGGSIWSADSVAAKQLALRMESGTTWVNRHGTIQPNAPFGGIKQSGIGVEFGLEGLNQNLNVKSLIRN